MPKDTIQSDNLQQDTENNLNPEFQFRSFRGLWIPKEIWFRKDLSLQEKCLYIEIESLQDEKKGGCFASNKYFALFFGTSERTIRRSLENLKKLDLIEFHSFDGRERILRVVKNDHAARTQKKSDRTKMSTPPGQKCPRSPIYNNKEDNKESKSHSPKIHSEEAKDLCNYFIACLKRQKPDILIPDNLFKWIDCIELMLKKDKRLAVNIKRVMEWATSDSFWKTNILSPEKLRKKFDALEMKMDSESKPQSQEVNTLEQNQKFSQDLIKKFPNRYKNREFGVFTSYIEFKLGGQSPSIRIEYDDKKFKTLLQSALLKWGDHD